MLSLFTCIIIAMNMHVLHFLLLVFIINVAHQTNIIVEGSKSKNYSLNPSCGHTFKGDQFATRVFGGSKTNEKEHPSLALVLYNNLFICGGTIICSKFILTAAHCVTDKYYDRSYVVKLGVHDRITLKEKHIKTYPVKLIIRHEEFKKFNDHTLINDIALLQVDSIEYTEYIQPICLPTIPDIDKYKSAVVEGWGVINNNEETSRVPQHAILSILEVEECRKSPVHKAIGKIKNIDLMTMCAHKYNADACTGDSGGPLYIKTQTGQRVQIGIVSFGVKCVSRYPGIYTRLTTYLPWIEKQLKNTTCFKYIFSNK